jgi:hypothetical protein
VLNPYTKRLTFSLKTGLMLCCSSWRGSNGPGRISSHLTSNKSYSSRNRRYADFYYSISISGMAWRSSWSPTKYHSGSQRPKTLEAASLESWQVWKRKTCVLFLPPSSCHAIQTNLELTFRTLMLGWSYEAFSSY